MPAHKKPDLPRGAGIYRIVNLVTGKCYVGSARNLAGRWRGHRCDLRGGKHHSVLLQRAWIKYGVDAFRFEVLEAVSDLATLAAREQDHIDRLNPCDPSRGYNILPLAQSSLGRKVSAETRAKLSAAFKGRKRAPWECALISAAQLGRRNSPEAIAKMRAAKLGKPRSEECKRKISETKRGRPPTDLQRQWHVKLAKVKPDDRIRIAGLRQDGALLREIAAEYRVSVPTIHRVLALHREAARDSAQP